MSGGQKPFITWHGGQVAAGERQALFGQQPVTVWLTGLSPAGKSPLAFALERELIDRGRACLPQYCLVDHFLPL